MADKLRIGVIGCGAISQIMHIPYLVDYDDLFELVAISDIYEPALKAVGDHYKIENQYTDWHELLDRDDIDAVVIAHSGSHYETIIASVQAGKHVMVEKPIAWNLRQAREIEQAVAGSDRIVQLAYHKRYDPAYPVVQEELAKMKDLGFARITVLHPSNEFGFSPFRIRRGNGNIDEGHIVPDTWEEQVQGSLRGLATGDLAPLVDEALGERKDDPRLRVAYGIITISLIHQVYMMEGFLGMPTRVVHTDVWREGLSIHSVLEYPNDLRCSLDWHSLSHLKDYREEYLFCGNFDRVALNFPGPYYRNFPTPITVQGGDGELSWTKEIIVSLDEAFRNELLAFRESVINGQPVRTTVQDAVRHMEIIQALIDAAD